jgi:hypothetical protein
MKAALLVGIALVLLWSCRFPLSAKEPTEEIVLIQNDYVCGECLFQTRLEITQTDMTYWEMPLGQSAFKKVASRPFAEAEWRALISSFHPDEFRSLPTVIGKPDEVDQGGWRLTIQTNQGSKSVLLDPRVKVAATDAIEKRLAALQAGIAPRSKPTSR